MFQINDSDFTWAITKATVIVITAFTSILGLAWVAVRKTSPK